MKKMFAIVLAVVLVATILPSAVFAKSPKTEFNACGPHYNLNLIAKDKTMPGDYNNPDRHTMFVPLDTSGELIPLMKPNNLDADYLPGTGIRIDITQGSEFAMIDGNGTDDTDGDGYLDGSFQIGPGQYDVYIAVRAKSPKYTDEEAVTNIDGWIEGYEENGALWYYLNVGSVTVKKNGSWTNATGLFFVSDSEDPFGLVTGDDVWVFTYMGWLDEGFTVGDTDYDFSNLGYFWQFDNHGNKLIQVRFYEK